ncbi:class III lanthionine synthetase LanKC [Streptomyces avicenniae]|uniref:class III lanthionine synthetase LanKC n=1 Tax=Streptomyces avicenniae TaxID=500153 RepID=UPI00069984B8|nr:class III lanthionine synthetase LanKC [Streptomyces avicenniae]
MNPEYALYCDADRWFYDAPRRVTETDDPRGALYPAACRPAPEGWERRRSGDWLSLAPLGHQLPTQGWKIHVSAAPDNAERVLERVSAVCLERGAAFKFLPSPYLLLHRNTKYADRAGSGKFVTVYPEDDDRCHALADALAAALDGEHGPYVLSDVRWGAGPVHVRYGAFAQRFTHAADGGTVPAVADPSGRLVPDLRGPAFRVPDWVEVPGFLAPHVAARSAQGVTDLPFTVERALHFSNGGGVYEGRDRATGARIVLKEARPYAGLAADGADAVERLERERRALERLAGLPCVPQLLGMHDVGEHRFLAMEHVPGTTLNTVFARRFPLSHAEPSPEQLADHTAWALRMHAMVAEAVATVHERGIAFGDLHMSNVMVAPDGASVTLLDFEAATPADERRRQIVANPAFVAPPDRRGTDVDRYALACLLLALFVPLTTLLPLDRRKAAHLAELAAARYPVDRALLDEAVREIGGPPVAGAAGYLPVRPDEWPAARESMVAAVLASASPEREDRFFPGDIAQFASPCGGWSLGHGTAGTLYALASAGVRCAEAEEWLTLRAKDPASGSQVGLYDGLTGVAWTLERLGRREAAVDLARLVARQPLEALGTGLHSGTAGVALGLLDLADATGDDDLRRAGLRCAQSALAALGRPAPGDRTGLLHGPTGTALLCVRLYERTGQETLLDAAADALRRDLARCVTGPDDSLVVDEGRRTMPYAGAGSVGIGLVLDDYLAHRADDAFETARQGILRAARSSFYVQPGLFRGVSGLVLHLARTTTPGDADGRAADVRRQSALLGWHAVPYQGHLAFPGEQLSRLSMDLATGTAGCLLALGAAHGAPGAHLPFLPPPPPPPDRRPQDRP